MCEISDQIKLCTCTDKTIEDLDDYWVLYRALYPEEEITVVVGIAIPPAPIDEKIKKINKKLLLKLLNTNCLFDKPMTFAQDDILQIHLGSENFYSRLEYQFKFTGSQWEYEGFDEMLSFSNNEEKVFGSIKNGLKKKQSKPGTH